MHGVAKKALILSTPILNSSGSGSTLSIVKALEYIGRRERNGTVINMSIVGDNSATVKQLINGMTIHKQFIFVVAAGNSGKDACFFSPADAERAITVSVFH
jgi:subtilisin family serine protease